MFFRLARARISPLPETPPHTLVGQCNFSPLSTFLPCFPPNRVYICLDRVFFLIRLRGPFLPPSGSFPFLTSSFFSVTSLPLWCVFQIFLGFRGVVNEVAFYISSQYLPLCRSSRSCFSLVTLVALRELYFSLRVKHLPRKCRSIP